MSFKSAIILFGLAVIFQAAIAQNGGETYNSEAGVYGTYLSFPGVSAKSGELMGYGLDFTHSFLPLVHDAAHRTAAAKNVIPKSWMRVTGQLGPTYSDGPDIFSTRIAGAGLVLPKFAVGGAFTLSGTSIEPPLSSDKRKTRDYVAGVFIDVYAAPTVLLREFIGMGNYSYDRNDVNVVSRSILQYEHHLVVAIDEGFGYEHELLVRGLEDSHRQINFNNYFEAALSTQFAILPLLQLEAIVPETGQASWLGGVGFGFQVHFTPRVLAQLIPAYSIDLKHSENDQVNVVARVAARF